MRIICQNLSRIYFPDNGKDNVYYWTIPFLTGTSQVIVNNPKINRLDMQKPIDGLSLYISSVKGGIEIGNGWENVYVPGRTTELYRSITSANVYEMYSYDTYPEEKSVVIGNLAPGIKIKSVTIEGQEAVLTDGKYQATEAEIYGNKMNVTVNYTVYGNPMNSTYEYIYSTVKEITDNESPAQWYTIDGIPADGNNLNPGIYVRVRNGKSEKIFVN